MVDQDNAWRWKRQKPTFVSEEFLRAAWAFNRFMGAGRRPRKRLDHDPCCRGHHCNTPPSQADTSVSRKKPWREPFRRIGGIAALSACERFPLST